MWGLAPKKVLDVKTRKTAIFFPRWSPLEIFFFLVYQEGSSGSRDFFFREVQEEFFLASKLGGFFFGPGQRSIVFF